MIKNCPPGVLCIDNLGGFIILFIFIVILVYFKNKPSVIEKTQTIEIQNTEIDKHIRQEP